MTQAETWPKEGSRDAVPAGPVRYRPRAKMQAPKGNKESLADFAESVAELVHQPELDGDSAAARAFFLRMLAYYIQLEPFTALESFVSGLSSADCAERADGEARQLAEKAAQRRREIEEGLFF
jgi:hypothetical protein